MRTSSLRLEPDFTRELARAPPPTTEPGNGHSMTLTPRADQQRDASIAFVLHAHLPWVAIEGKAITLEEAWLYEAMWESYLPLFDVLDRVAARAVAGSAPTPLCTLSLSPPLLAMLGDGARRERFRQFARELLQGLERASEAHPELARAIADHRGRLTRSLALFEELRCDLVGGFVELANRGIVELTTTAATHAFLPGLLTEACVRAQIRIGLRYFHAVTKRHARSLWLPECGYDERLAQAISDCGASSTVLAAHGIELGRPRPPFGTRTPILADAPFAFFGRANDLVMRIWSHETGYPADAVYREFYASLPLPSAGAERTASPFDRALKPYAVTGTAHKAGYQPDLARARAEAHAADFLAQASSWLCAGDAPQPIAVLAFDAELFGHWWWEGPHFLEHVLAGAPKAGLTARSLESYLERDPVLPVAQPATSTWGHGGYAEVWTHPSSSHAARVAHRGERRVLLIDALVRDTPRSETQRLARLFAIRELFLLQASDYAFMLRSGEFAAFAEHRLLEHARRLDELCSIAERAKEAPGDRARVDALVVARPLFVELDEDAWADTFDPW